MRLAAGLVLAVVVAGGAGLYVARLAIARDVLVGWLKDRGVDAELEFDTFGLGGLSGTLRVGSKSAPVLSADRLEVGYGWQGFWSGDPLGLEVRSVRLVRPILHGTWKDGRLTLGSLDRVVEEFRRKPPRPDARLPSIRIEDGYLNLQSDYGALQVRAEALVNDGKLIRLDARSAPATVREGEAFADLGPGGLVVRTRGDRMDIGFQVFVGEMRAGDLSARAATLRLAGQAPYPDLKRRRGDGAVALSLILAGERLALGAHQLGDARLEGRFDGVSAGWIPNLSLKGSGAMEAAADTATLGGAKARKLRVKLDAPEAAWTRAGGDRLGGRYGIELAAAELTTADLRLREAKAAFKGSGAVKGPLVDLQMRGEATAQGGWSGLGAVAASDDAETAALKRAVGDFTLVAPALALNITHSDMAVSLPAPLVVRTRSGGMAEVRAVGGAPVFAGQGGRFALDVRGGGLPTVAAKVDRFVTTGDGASAHADIRAKGSFAMVRDGEIAGAGTLRLAKAGLTFTGADCLSLTAAKLELGENDVDALKTQLCPVTGAPLLASLGGETRLRAQARALSAEVPFLEARVEDGAAGIDFTVAKRASAVVRIDAAQVIDTARETRFRPLRASGVATLKAETWQADLKLADPAGHEVVQARLTHDGASGRGGLVFDTGDLAFSEGGLQPAALSPLLAMVAAPARGEARFTGKVDWTAQAMTSSGLLHIDRFNFQTAAGPVAGLSGHVAFDSLAPLTAAPGQVLKAERVDAFGPLTDVQATFALEAAALKVQSGSAALGGGRLKLSALDLPLAPDKPFSGVLDVEGVQVADLVKASPFGDRAALDAKVSGHLPFSVTPEGVRISGGELHAIAPGTLSIRREALTSVQADGAVAVDAPPGVPAQAAATTDNTFTDFAYQAMEHLAFERLAAEIDSRPEGRLGVMLYVKGEHNPPQRQELRVGVVEAINGSYAQRELPLPSGTKVDLALDTSLNLDQLLADYAEYQKLRGSRPVQP